MATVSCAVALTSAVGAVGCGKGNLTGASGRAPATTSSATCRDKPGGTSEYIVGGVDSGARHPAVVFLANGNLSLCTGTLISPSRVLTAAHCLADATGVGFGPIEGDTARVVPIARKVGHPDYDPMTSDNDVAYVDLAIAVTDVVPIPIARTAPRVGETIRLVGYGLTHGMPDVGGGTKREVTVTISRTDPTTWDYPEGPRGSCFGDSGGPGLRSLADGGYEVMGVTSTGYDYECVAGGTYTRVDTFVAFILSDPTTPPTMGLCDNACMYSVDGECDDGGPDSLYDECAYGTDCTDCGVRDEALAPGATEEPTAPSDPETPGDPSLVTVGCDDSCATAEDGVCDDGGAGSLYCVCVRGSDCSDCGPR